MSPSRDLLFTLPDEVRAEVERRERIMRLINAAPKVRPEAEKHARLLEFKSGSRVVALYYQWLKEGWPALVNHNKCGGCTLPGCGGKRASRLDQSVLEAWATKAGSTHKNALRDAWRKLIEDLREGKPIAKVGTWRDIWLALYPTRPVPAECPWHRHAVPPGWSFANFMRVAPAKVEYVHERDGIFAASGMLPQVSMSLGKLLPLEVLVVDDHRLDFMVFAQDEGNKWQLVELWGLFVMDLATRMIIMCMLKPRIIRADGTREAFAHRDMQHLIARVLARYGYPTRHKQTWIVENAAAAVSENTENLLARVTDGQVVIHRTGVHCDDLRINGFPERWGNPKGKPWLESTFNPLDIALGDVKGQIGSDYSIAPAERDARVQDAGRWLPVLNAMSEDEIKGLTMGFEFAADAERLLQLAVHRLNTRTDHQCKDFRTVEFFRWSDGDPMPKPVLITDAHDAPTRKDVEAFLKLPPEARAHLLHEYGTRRLEMPLERWNRLHDPKHYQAVTPAVFGDLYMDSVKAVYAGGDVLDVMVKQGRKESIKIRYKGTDHQLAIGMQVICRHDADHPLAGVWLQDERGRSLGHMMATDLGAFDEQEKLQEQLGVRMKAQREVLKDVRRRVNKPDALRQRLQEVERNTSALQMLNAPPANVAPEQESSAALVNQVTTAKRAKRPTYKPTLSAHEETSTEQKPEGFSF